MSKCKDCKHWAPQPWTRKGSDVVAYHTGRCLVILKVLETSSTCSYIETPAAFGCTFWAAPKDLHEGAHHQDRLLRERREDDQ